MAIRVFECPNCKETIDDSMTRCPYCQAAVDPEAAKVAADLTEKVTDAVNEASYTRILAGSLPVLWGLGLIFMAANYAQIIIVVGALPWMVLRWRSRYGKLQTDDPDYERAKKRTNISLLLWIVFLILDIALAALWVKALRTGR